MRRPDRFSAVLLWVLGIAAAIQIIHGLWLPIVGDDAAGHLNWLDQFSSLFAQGIHYPRWLTHSNGGFGSPSFYFYPPLPYFLAALVAKLTPDLYTQYHIIGLFGGAMSSIACYCYVSKLRISRASAIAASLFYFIAPYRFVDLYLRNALGEHFAFAFLPLVLASVELCLQATNRRDRVKAALLSTIGWAGLVLSNIPVSVISVIAVSLYVLARMWKRPSASYPLLIGGVLALMLSGIYVVPMLEMREHVQMGHLFDIGSREHRLSYILLEAFRVEWTEARVLNAVTLLAAIACGISLAWRVMKAEASRKINAAILALLALAIGFQIPVISPWLYKLPLIELIQYSWRWNVILTLGLALYLACTPRLKLLSVHAVVLSGILLSTIAAGFSFASENARHKSPDILKAFYFDAPEYVPVHGPKTYKEVVRFAQLYKTTPEASIAQGSGAIATATVHPHYVAYTAMLPEDAVVVFHRFYWPAWKLYVDGDLHEQGVDQFGRALARIPAGGHRVEYVLEKTLGQVWGFWLSMLGLSFLLLGAVYLVTARAKRMSVLHPSK